MSIKIHIYMYTYIYIHIYNGPKNQHFHLLYHKSNECPPFNLMIMNYAD